MRKVWQKVFEDTSAHRAEIVKAILEGEGLNPVIVDLKDSSYHFGKFEVRVDSMHVLEAIRIIKKDINFE
jgi:hypothetical protein